MKIFEWFESQYRTYLKAPIDSLTSGITGKLSEFQGWIKTPLDSFSKGVTDKLSQFELWIKTPLDSVKGGLDNITKGVGDVSKIADEKVMKPVMALWKTTEQNIQVWEISRIATVEQLDKLYGLLPEEDKKNPAVAAAYQNRRDVLIADGYNTKADLVLNPLAKGIASGVWAIEAKAMPKIMGWMDKFGAQYNLKKEELESMKELAQTGEFGLNAVVSFVLGVTIQPAISVATAPIWESLGQKAWQILPVSLLPVETLVRLKYRQEIESIKYIEEFSKHGMSGVNIGLMEKAALYYPTPSDFIQFAVRDTFKEDIVKEYGLDTGYPSEMESYVLKTGMSPTWLRHFWRAHWELPSPTAGYEMLQRQVIDEDGLRRLLKTADYAPGWIQPMIDISYAPITRVDLRRLYKDGVIDEARLLKGYRDLGYNLENASYLTEWTMIDVIEENRSITKEEILKAFSSGRIGKTDATQMLESLRYAPEDAAFIVSNKEYQLSEEARIAEVETLIKELVDGKLPIEEFRKRISGLELPIKEQNKYIGRAEQEIRKQVSLPAKEDLIKWLKAKIITEEEFSKRMVRLRYLPDDVKLYIEEVKKRV